MAFFNVGKKKKEEPLDILIAPPSMPAQTQPLPIDQVIAMRQQGYSNNQIIQILQSHGYNTNQIFDAINQAGLGMGLQQAPEQLEAMPNYEQGYEQPYQRETQPPVSINEERIQELAEAIIDEKWEEFAQDIKKVIEWKEKSEDRIAKLEQQILDLRLSIESLTKSIMTKISSYDQNIVDVGVEVKAMEKVFQKVLPTLTESVNKLDRMTKGYKQEEKK